MTSLNTREIGSEHARAICDEIGDRLRHFLNATSVEPSGRILSLLLQLQLSEMKEALGHRRGEDTFGKDRVAAHHF